MTYKEAVKTDVFYMSYSNMNMRPQYPGEPIPVPELYDGRNAIVKNNSTKLTVCTLETKGNNIGSLSKDCTKKCDTFYPLSPASLYYCKKSNDSATKREVSNGTFSYLTIKTSSKIQVVIRIDF